MATYTEIEIRPNVTNGVCSIAKGKYPLDIALHIEISPNKLYGNTTKTPVLAYRYSKTGIAGFSEKFKAKDGVADTWELDTTLAYYYAKTDEMYATVDYSYEVRYTEFKNNLIRCTTDYPDGIYPLEKITIHLTADSGCEFQVSPKISYYAYDKSVTPWKWGYWDYEFVRLSETEYEYTFTPDSSNKVYKIQAESTVKTTITDKYGLIAVYKPDKEVLIQLAKTRFTAIKYEIEKMGNVSIGQYVEDYIDTHKYAVSLRKFYFKVDTVLRENIILGPYNTEIECDVVGNDIVSINMGTVEIKGRYSNGMDYENTEMDMYLPFIGFVRLKPADFMDKHISLVYEVNVISGDAVAVLCADNDIMQIETCNVSYTIPYRLNDTKDYIESYSVNGSLNPNNTYLLDEKPFINVKSYNAVQDDNLPYRDTKFYSKFGDLEGYVEATEIDFEVVHDYITKTEIDEIITLLQNGVFL